MARIVYGVSGEGSGHSSRSRTVLRHLVARGHEVRVVTYDRGIRNLSQEFPVVPIEGLHIATRNNKVSLTGTFAENLAKLRSIWGKGHAARLEAFRGFVPDAVFTDFEPVTAHLARYYDLPLVTIDNQHRMRSLRLPVPPGRSFEARQTELLIQFMIPHPCVSLVTTFVQGEPRNDHTLQFAPLLNREVRELQPETGDHVLVYFTRGFRSAIELLPRYGRERFLVYGEGREGTEGNLTFKAPSRSGFLEDLRRAKAVISTAGFTLMTETLHLGKPLLALPMAGQYEQELNGHLLQLGGWGRSVQERDLGSETIGEFLYRVPELEQALRGYHAPDEGALLAQVDALLEDDLALLRQYHAPHATGRDRGLHAPSQP